MKYPNKASRGGDRPIRSLPRSTRETTHALPRHLRLLHLEITCAVNHSADLRVVVELLQETRGFEVITDLGELVRDGIGAVASPAELRVGTEDDVEDLFLGLARRRAVGDT